MSEELSATIDFANLVSGKEAMVSTGSFVFLKKREPQTPKPTRDWTAVYYYCILLRRCKIRDAGGNMYSNWFDFGHIGESVFSVFGQNPQEKTLKDLHFW